MIIDIKNFNSCLQEVPYKMIVKVLTDYRCFSVDLYKGQNILKTIKKVCIQHHWDYSKAVGIYVNKIPQKRLVIIKDAISPTQLINNIIKINKMKAFL